MLYKQIEVHKPREPLYAMIPATEEDIIAELPLEQQNILARLSKGAESLKEEIKQLQAEIPELGHRDQSINEMLIGAYTVALKAFEFNGESHNNHLQSDQKSAD